MCFLAVHPKDLSLGLLDDLALFLDRRRINPVFRIEQHRRTLGFRIKQARDARDRFIAGMFHADLPDMEIVTAVAEIARERLFDDGMDAAFKGCDRNCFVAPRA